METASQIQRLHRLIMIEVAIAVHAWPRARSQAFSGVNEWVHWVCVCVRAPMSRQKYYTFQLKYWQMNGRMATGLLLANNRRRKKKLSKQNKYVNIYVRCLRCAAFNFFCVSIFLIVCCCEHSWMSIYIRRRHWQPTHSALIGNPSLCCNPALLGAEMRVQTHRYNWICSKWFVIELSWWSRT